MMKKPDFLYVDTFMETNDDDDDDDDELFCGMVDRRKAFTVDSLISEHHRGNGFCPLIGGVRLLESLIFLTFCCLGRGTLKVLSF